MNELSFAGILKNLFLGYRVYGDSYYYRLDPFVVKFQNYQELLVTYRYNLEWVRIVLSGVINTYKE